MTEAKRQNTIKPAAVARRHATRPIDPIHGAIEKHRMALGAFLVSILKEGDEEKASLAAGRGPNCTPKTDKETQRTATREQQLFKKMLQTVPTTSAGLGDVLEYVDRLCNRAPNDDVLHSSLGEIFVATVKASFKRLRKQGAAWDWPA